MPARPQNDKDNISDTTTSTEESGTGIVQAEPETAVITTAPANAGEIKPRDRFKDYMQQRAAIDGANLAYDVAAAQVDKILTADGEEAIWEADALDQVAGRDLIDVEQRIFYYTVHKSNRSDFETPWGVFVMVHAARLADGEEVIWNTGAPLIISKLRALEAGGFLPADAVIRGTPSSNGTVLKLRPVPKRAVPAS